MFGGHMKRIGIMGTAIMSLLLAAGVPGHAQQDQPNGKQDRDQKDENRGRPRRPQNRPQPSRGEEPRQAERNRGQKQREEKQQRQKEENPRRQESQQEVKRQRQTQIQMNQRQAQRERDRQQQMQQQRLSRERQAQLIQRQQLRVAEYRRNLEDSSGVCSGRRSNCSASGVWRSTASRENIWNTCGRRRFATGKPDTTTTPIRTSTRHLFIAITAVGRTTRSTSTVRTCCGGR